MGGILLIDAEQPFADQLSSSLRGAGYDVTLLDENRDAIEAAREVRPAGIVLCVELPKTSGYSICNKLKKDPDLKSIPLIITSKEATPETFAQHKRLKTRAEEYLIKPFADSELLAKLTQLVPVSSGGELAGAMTSTFTSLSDELDLSSPSPAVTEAGNDARRSSGDDDFRLSPEDDALLASLDRLDSKGAEADGAAAGGGDLADLGASVKDDDLAALVDAFDAPAGGGAKAAPNPSQQSRPRTGAADSILDDAPPAKRSDSRLESRPKAVTAPPTALGDVQQLERLRRDNGDLKARLAELEARLSSAEELARSKDAQLAASSASSGGASTAREVLNLKDQLRAKDKELLSLKDTKDKELLALKDELFEKEKVNVDLQEQIEALREEVKQRDGQVREKTTEVSGLQARLRTLTNERDDLAGQVREHEEQARAMNARLLHEEAVRDKAKQAVEIAFSLLNGDVDVGSAEGRSADAE